ncbi:hypothetical protein Tco_0561841 [Tanacetum coccineum]
MNIQSFNLTKKSGKNVSKRFKHGSSLKTSPLLYLELCNILFEKCSASGSIRRPVAEKRPSSQISGVKLVEIEDDVSSLNKEGGSSAASEHHVNENVRDDNDGDVEVAQPIGSEADQQYMINL